ncbi:ABC transporter substrate-binding protein [Kutzneria kofuensis]|uniref:Putative spermidine/putrescine transport system substrate-binding protein n=1 Tax=Kutzneria kofuensis TaxID=103725 RepID=A0A7W9KAT3_9PSEU|nr:ABC transporter substrate-binding protein [Kutzneria kofuensis]MBB5889081.1 putative spermidine/putrescine transport system substrate-binding protein [Kutzneria kofuensis]
MNRSRTAVAAGLLAVVALAATACGSSSGASSAGTTKAATAHSAADLGGMDALVAAAKAEGTLNVITLPRTWAGYGDLMDNFTKKYGIKINDANPDGSSQDEINAVKQLKGQDRAPDVLDLGSSFALSAAAANLLAPYQVATWKDIPDAQKDSQGRWYNDYGGYISIGYDAGRVKTPPTSIADLAKPDYKGMVALNGDPTKAGAAFAGVYAAALAKGGSVDDIQPGIDFFGQLKKSGNFIPVGATQATIQSGQTPITIDWDYLQVSAANTLKGKVDWKVVVPSDGLYANYYNQAISATAPHPAAARLWEEYLYSVDGQNGFLQGWARPVELAAMQAAGTVNKAELAALPRVSGNSPFPTEAQLDAAKKVIADNWAKTVG